MRDYPVPNPDRTSVNVEVVDVETDRVSFTSYEKQKLTYYLTAHLR